MRKHLRPQVDGPASGALGVCTVLHDSLLKIAISRVVSAPRQRVFAALVDPVILQRCIPGCESLAEVSPDVYEAKLKIGIGGLKGNYSGKATIQDKAAPDSLTLGLDGRGGPGFVRGSAAIQLSDDSDGRSTLVACAADVHVGGLLAAVGSRLIEAAAKKMADDFFQQLSSALAT